MATILEYALRDTKHTGRAIVLLPSLAEPDVTAVFILIGPWVTHYTHSRYGWLPLGTNISQSKQQWPEVDSVRAHGLCEGGVSEGCDHAMSALRVTAAL